MTSEVLDTYREVVTPEGVALHLPAAGPIPRALAWFIDLLVRFALLFLISLTLGILGSMGIGLYMIALFLVYWGYPIVLEGVWNGRTLGKRALGLQVVSANGAPVGWMAVITRNLLRTVDMLPIGYAVGLMACLFDSSGRRLGDMVAGTLVVHTIPRVEVVNIPSQASVMPLIPLRPEEQTAIIQFGERAAALSSARQAELADIAESLTGARGTLGVRRLYAIANGLLGR